MLPKFLLADNSQHNPESIYVVHNESPRCIFECDVDEDFTENYKIHWIDNDPNDKALLDDLATAAEKFLDDELDAQERLFEEQFLDEDSEED